MKPIIFLFPNESTFDRRSKIVKTEHNKKFNCIFIVSREYLKS